MGMMKRNSLLVTMLAVIVVSMALSAVRSFSGKTDVPVQLLFTADVYGYLTPCG